MERANDKPKAVQIEIRAAEIDHGCAIMYPSGEWNGWMIHYSGYRTPFGPKTLAGWLSREMNTHHEPEMRDSDAWTWDSLRPVAGQYEEWLAKRAAETP